MLPLAVVTARDRPAVIKGAALKREVRHPRKDDRIAAPACRSDGRCRGVGGGRWHSGDEGGFVPVGATWSSGHPSLFLPPWRVEGSSSGRSWRAKDEAPAMAETNQAWDWGVELRDEERSELELLRETVAQLRSQLDQEHGSLRRSRRREQDLTQALRQLDEARPWQRRRVRRVLRKRRLL
jgi:hypothetical protein